VSPTAPDAPAGSKVRAPRYRAAGVDLDAADRLVEMLRPLATQATRAEVLGSIGGFAGCFALDTGRFREPVLVATSDGVGTKLALARAAGRCSTVGIDLVAMLVDDLVCVGAEPAFVLDYVAVGRLEPEVVVELVAGIAEGCRLVGAALLGGETAEHPGMLAPGDVDVAGFALGIVERSRMLGPARVHPDDLLVGLASPGLRSNGYSLARRVLLDEAGRRLEEPAFDGTTRSLADELLEPSVLYAPHVLALMATLDADSLHAAAHITGGGIPGNLRRVLPSGCAAVVDASSWEMPRIFEEVRRLGHLDDEEMLEVFNLGIGMVLVVAKQAADAAIEHLARRGIEAWRIGRVELGEPEVRVRGFPAPRSY
jgi:phosphoribosylformylglycinamidine cyclo-ligase